MRTLLDLYGYMILIKDNLVNLENHGSKNKIDAILSLCNY